MSQFIPSLKDLPTPPPGKWGWPWTKKSEILPSQMPDGSLWPQISIITPSYNQGCFLEETIRSILLQGYPNLEYIVIDGGSIDDSVKIIEKYSPWIDYWISEKDRGQSDAINKGFAVSHGEICAYLNSDDLFLPGALKHFAVACKSHPTQLWFASAVLYGESLTNNLLWKPKCTNLPYFVVHQSFAQQGTFWKSNIRSQPWFQVNKYIHLDQRFFIENYIEFGPPVLVNQVTALFRKHSNSKTFAGININSAEFQGMIEEVLQKVDNTTQKSIEIENLRQQLVMDMVKLLSTKSPSFKNRLSNLLVGIELLSKAPLKFRDRIFVSGCVHLFLKLLFGTY